MDQKSRFLPLLTIAAAASVVAFSGIGIAAITGHLQIAKSNLNPFSAFGGVPALRTSDTQSVRSNVALEGLTRSTGATRAQGQPVNFRPGARIPARKTSCANCGVVDSIKARAANGGDDKVAAALGTTGRAYQIEGGALSSLSFVVIVRMENGSVRTIHENQRPPFGIGERVKLVNGSVVPQG